MWSDALQGGHLRRLRQPAHLREARPIRRIIYAEYS